MPEASERRVCRVLNVNRSTIYKKKNKRKSEGKSYELDEVMAERIKEVIHEYPWVGYRMVWAVLRFLKDIKVNKKKVYRIMKLKGWLLSKRVKTPRPRVKKKKSATSESNVRWAMDVTHIDCGDDGWGHLAAIIDCHDREIIGYEFALRGRANEAERALESACLKRYGTLYPNEKTPVIRSDNGLIFQSKRFRSACSAAGMSQEFITPYSPEQNGLIERFFRTIKQECVWIHNFKNFEEAKQKVEEWIRWYNEQRPHSSLGYLSPVQFRQQQVLKVA